MKAPVILPTPEETAEANDRLEIEKHLVVIEAAMAELAAFPLARTYRFGDQYRTALAAIRTGVGQLRTVLSDSRFPPEG